MYLSHDIQDKEGSIPHDDLGRSIASVQVLQRKHETFDREVSGLGNKVSLIICLSMLLAIEKSDHIHTGCLHKQYIFDDIF